MADIRDIQKQLISKLTQVRDLKQKQLNLKKGKVAGDSTFRPPAARGDDFASDFTESGGLDVMERTGGSVNDAISVFRGKLSESDVAKAAARNRSAILSAIKKRQDNRVTSTLASDAARASNLNTTTGEAITTKGSRSSKVLTDKEIEDLGAQGYFEGDFVPGKGVLLPDGSFDRTILENAAEATSRGEEAISLAEERMKEIRDMAEKYQNQEDQSEFNGISTDDAIVAEEDAAIKTITEPSLVFENTFAMLDSLEASIQDKLDAEIESAKLTYKSDLAATRADQASEVGQTSVGLAGAGGYLGFSGSATGVMLSLTKSHRAELEGLKTKRDQAIAEARQAAANSQFDLVRDKAQLVKEIERDVYDRQVKYNEKMQEAADKQVEEAQKTQTESDIFTAINAGKTSVEDIFDYLGGNVDVNTISKFLKDTGAVEGGFEFSSSQTAKLLGSGMSNDDIKALSEYVMENGYDETVRNAMSPAQRAAADKVFSAGTDGTGVKDIYAFTDQELRKIRAAGLMDASWEEQAQFLYGDDTKPYESVYTQQILDGSATLDSIDLEAQETVRSELIELGFGSSAVPQWFQTTVNNNAGQTIEPGVLKSSWEDYRLKALGETPKEVESNWFVNWING